MPETIHSKRKEKNTGITWIHRNIATIPIYEGKHKASCAQVFDTSTSKSASDNRSNSEKIRGKCYNMNKKNISCEPQ
jgi:hypothetical protein